MAYSIEFDLSPSEFQLATKITHGNERCSMQMGSMLVVNSAFHWFKRGLLCLFSMPVLILNGAFIGFSSLAREAGFTLLQTEFMVATIWALPSKVVLIGAIMSKSTLIATFIAVCLSAVRLMPMVVAIVPEMRTPTTRKWVLYALSHFVAVTAWVMALERFKTVPRDYRTSFFAGLVSVLLVSNMTMVFLTFQLADAMPPLVSAALVFVTPLYFLFSLWGSARERASHYAMVTGLALTPLFHAVMPQADILGAGIAGGVLAYFIARQQGASQS
jgi:predicted branched-subunit amino acid permease